MKSNGIKIWTGSLDGCCSVNTIKLLRTSIHFTRSSQLAYIKQWKQILIFDMKNEPPFPPPLGRSRFTICQFAHKPNIPQNRAHQTHTHTENMATYSSSLLASYTLITKATAYTFSAVAWVNQQHPEQMKNEKSRPPPFLSSKLCSSKQQRAAQTKSIPKDGINPNKTISKMPRIRT